MALNIEFVMSSPRIKFLEATKQEVLDAVKDTSEFTIRCEGEDTWFVRKNPLPVLRKRKENKKADRRKDINGGRGRDPHAIGYVQCIEVRKGAIFLTYLFLLYPFGCVTYGHLCW